MHYYSDFQDNYCFNSYQILFKVHHHLALSQYLYELSLTTSLQGANLHLFLIVSKFYFFYLFKTMGLGHTDDGPTGVITRRAAQLVMITYEHHMVSCSMILNEGCPTTVESLQVQGTALKKNLALLQTAECRLGQSEPDPILVKEYLDKKNDIAGNSGNVSTKSILPLPCSNKTHC